MDFDLETILTVLTVLSGLIWLVDALAFMRPRRRRQQAQAQASAGTPAVKQRRDPLLVDYSKSFFPVLLAVLLLRSFLAEPFHIPSSSMVPTLLVGDFILVNKFDYGLRLPVIHTRIIPIGEPRRGDVVVFRYPEDSARRYCQSHPLCADTGSMREVESSAGTDYIKRVIGLPGDHIAYRDDVLYINGVAAPGQLLGLYRGSDALGATLRRETLGSVTHDILATNGQLGPQGEWVVPAGEYFVMGDNRGNSFDSRWWGFVPERNIVGKAFFVWMNWDAFHDSALWHRVGTVIH